MRTVVFIIATVFIALYPLDSFAEEQAASLFQEGLACFEQIDFTCARNKLSKAEALESESQPGSKTHIEILKHLANTQAALSDQDSAVESFKKLLLYQPDFRLGEEDVSPKIMRLFTLALESIKPVEEIPAEPEFVEGDVEFLAGEMEIVYTPPPDPFEKQHRFSAGIETSAAFLLGDDTDSYNHGLLVEGGFRGRIIKGFHLGGALVYQFHKDKNSEGDIHLLGAALEPSYCFEFRSYSIDIAGNLGLATFGRGNINDELSLLFRLKFAALYRITPQISLGLIAGPGSAVLLSRKAASYFITTGLIFKGSF